VTALVLVLACIASMFAIYSVRGNPGRAVADTALLVILIGLITVANLILSQFIDTGNVGTIIVVSCAGALALDALYGLMAPERQKQRDKMLRRLMKRRA
jgi:ABC-type transport system involved in cytochrome c biogenesis permease subunit